MSPDERFDRKVDRSGECWVWTGAHDSFGHGRLTRNYVNVGAHRVAWERSNGPIPEGMCVLHRCDNPPCVRPDHLFLGTKRDNSRDMIAKGRGRGQFRDNAGEKHPRAKLTNAAVIEIRARYAVGGVTQDQLAAEFGVSQRAVLFVLQGKHWRNVA
jgi:hypothetical protein